MWLSHRHPKYNRSEVRLMTSLQHISSCSFPYISKWRFHLSSFLAPNFWSHPWFLSFSHNPHWICQQILLILSPIHRCSASDHSSSPLQPPSCSSCFPPSAGLLHLLPNYFPTLTLVLWHPVHTAAKTSRWTRFVSILCSKPSTASPQIKVLIALCDSALPPLPVPGSVHPARWPLPTWTVWGTLLLHELCEAALCLKTSLPRGHSAHSLISFKSRLSVTIFWSSLPFYFKITTPSMFAIPTGSLFFSKVHVTMWCPYIEFLYHLFII